MWECASIKAGITVLPERSTRRAPAGTVTSPRLPTAVNLLFSTTKAEFSIGVPPSPVMSRAPSKTVIAVWLWTCPVLNTARKHPKIVTRADIRLVTCIFDSLTGAVARVRWRAVGIPTAFFLDVGDEVFEVRFVQD